MIQLKDKLKVNGGTRRYMEMIGLSLAFSSMEHMHCQFLYVSL